MTNARKDENRVKVAMAVQDNGADLVQLAVDDATNRLLATYLGDDGTSNDGIAPRDENHVPVLMAVSADDGVTPVAIYATSDGKLLI